MRWSLLAVVLSGCLTTTSSTTNVGECALEATLDVSEAHVGDVVHLAGGPFTRTDDTVVRVAGVPATLIEVATCDLCDTCVSDQGCTCGASCDVCAAACADCDATIAFTVPDVPPGTAAVVLVNRYGATADLALTVLAPPADTDDTAVDTDTL